MTAVGQTRFQTRRRGRKLYPRIATRRKTDGAAPGSYRLRVRSPLSIGAGRLYDARWISEARTWLTNAAHQGKGPVTVRRLYDPHVQHHAYYAAPFRERPPSRPGSVSAQAVIANRRSP